jgi:threonine dehydrogenase-like Zn-dependent dehydrogenase
MKALWFDGKKLALKELPAPRPAKNEALIRILYAGICNTDLEIFKGYMKFKGVPGHEFVGNVEQGPKNWLGKRVVGEINLGCGKCSYCRAGMKKHCPYRTVLGIANKNGAFAEFLTLPVENLRQIPAAVPDLDAVFVEPLAAAYRVLEQVEIKRGQKVIVLGDGKLGQLIARVIRQKTNGLILVGKHPQKLAIAKKQGIRTMLASRLKIVPEQKPNLVIEATGNQAGFETAMEICRPLGTIVLKSTFSKIPEINLSKIVVDELKIVGSRCGNFPAAIELLARGKVDLSGLLSGVFDLENFQQAFQKATSTNALKVVFKCMR